MNSVASVCHHVQWDRAADPENPEKDGVCFGHVFKSWKKPLTVEGGFIVTEAMWVLNQESKRHFRLQKATDHSPLIFGSNLGNVVNCVEYFPFQGFTFSLARHENRDSLVKISSLFEMMAVEG